MHRIANAFANQRRRLRGGIAGDDKRRTHQWDALRRSNRDDPGMRFDRTRIAKGRQCRNTLSHAFEIGTRIGVRMRPADSHAQTNATLAVREHPCIAIRRDVPAHDQRRFVFVPTRCVKIQLCADAKPRKSVVQMLPARERAGVAGGINYAGCDNLRHAAVGLAHAHAADTTRVLDHRVGARAKANLCTGRDRFLREPLQE